MVFCPDTDSFSELKGKGVALGVDEKFTYVENSRDFFAVNQIILVGTDGIWEMINHSGEPFGKERAMKLLRKYYHQSAKEIADNIILELEQFCGNRKPDDDITLAVIRTFREN